MTTETDQIPVGEPPMSREWNYHPKLPIITSPLFQWPPRIGRIFVWLAKSWLSLSTILIFLATATICWFYFHPSPTEAKELAFGWVFEIWLRNLVLLSVFAGGLHLYFHTYKRQGDRRKFDRRDLARKHRGFTWNNQVLDNMFWSLGSGVAFWTAYEVLYYWAAANGYAPTLVFADNPVWFIAFFLLIPIWSSLHFYWIHRLLHWPPLYSAAHALHHRNVNIGPWTGISMHPIEHALYFSNILLHFVVPSSPLHVLFHMHIQALSPAASHSGYEALLVEDEDQLRLGDFFHQLHHRYFECNYGTIEMPWDVWFGSFHDGSPEATRRVRKRLRPQDHAGAF